MQWLKQLWKKWTQKNSVPRIDAAVVSAPIQEASFNDFNFHEKVQYGLQDLRFEKPTPIQVQAIPLVLKGHVLIALAQTGTGKTAAFLLPIFQKMIEDPTPGTKALILTPTRELAAQIDEQITGLAYHCGIQSVTVVGGVDAGYQERGLKAGSDIVVATPGRLLDHMRFNVGDFSKLKFLVIDEADRMYDMGFLPDLTRIINAMPATRQTLLFSATMPDPIRKLIGTSLKDPQTIHAGQVNKAAESIEQRALLVDGHNKERLLEKILNQQDCTCALVFVNTKRGAQKLFQSLRRKNRGVECIHGDRTQEERNEAMNRFRNGSIQVLVATDVAARGIDVTGISHVINFEVPQTHEEYIHRIGRTGRAQFKGKAFTLVTRDELNDWNQVQQKIQSRIQAETTSFYSGPTPTQSNSSERPHRHEGHRQHSKNAPHKGGQHRHGSHHRKQRQGSN